MLQLLLKLWPALIPIILYVLWILIKKSRQKPITEYEIVAEKSDKKITKTISDFSLQNKHFIIVIYLTLIFGILAIVTMAINNSGRQNYDVRKLELPRE